MRRVITVLPWRREETLRRVITVLPLGRGPLWAELSPFFLRRRTTLGRVINVLP